MAKKPVKSETPLEAEALAPVVESTQTKDVVIDPNLLLKKMMSKSVISKKSITTKKIFNQGI